MIVNSDVVSHVAVTTSTDALGDVTYVEAAPVSVRAMVAGRSSAESADSRTPAVLTGLTLYIFDLAVVPGASDWFTVRGERYEVEGQAHRWGQMGVEVAVKRAEASP